MDDAGMAYDWISVTTDYGLRDGFVAACHGVIARLAPAVRVLDVTHEVPPQDVRHGAMALAQTVPFLPEAVHVAVVAPGVGTDRNYNGAGYADHVNLVTAVRDDGLVQTIGGNQGPPPGIVSFTDWHRPGTGIGTPTIVRPAGIQDAPASGLAPVQGSQGTYNALSASVELFARGTDNLLGHTYLGPDGRSGAWSTHGDWAPASQPTSVYNPNSGAVEVYARDTVGLLIHTYIGRDGQYGPWDVVGDRHIAGRPSVVYNPNTRAVEIYAVATDGKPVHTYLGADLKHGPWTVAGEGVLTDSPSVAPTPFPPPFEFYGRDTLGLLVHTYLGADGQYGPWDVVGDWHLASRPVAVYDDYRRSVEIY